LLPGSALITDWVAQIPYTIASTPQPTIIHNVFMLAIVLDLNGAGGTNAPAGARSVEDGRL
jgi:hypothetical protein